MIRGKYNRNRRSVPLGDALERQLKAWGITQEKYKDVKAKFGLPPTCACRRRKAWLNAVGRYLGIAE